MELNFKKETISCLRRVVSEMRDQEETLELRVQDGMPDVDRVVACWGQPVIRGKEWRNSGICINGGVMVWFVYSSDEDNDLHCMDAWLPFQFKKDFSDYEQDGAITVQPLLHTLDIRTISARKLMLRAVIGLTCEAVVDGEIEFFTPLDIPDDIQLLNNKQKLMLPRLMDEKSFRMEETFSMPNTSVSVKKVLYYQVSPTVLEEKVMSDKVVFRGTLSLHLLYLDNNGQIVPYDTDFPFSQFSELSDEFSTEAKAQISVAVSAVDLESIEDNSYKLTVGLIGQYSICDLEEVTFLEDAYSPVRGVKLSGHPLQLHSLFEDEHIKLPLQVECDDPGFQIVDAVFYPAHPLWHSEGGCKVTEFTGNFSLLGYDNDGQIVHKKQSWQFGLKSDDPENCLMNIWMPCYICPQISNTGINVHLAAEMTIVPTKYSELSATVVDVMAVDENVSADPNRPSLILRRCGVDNLWSVAKNCGSTVEKIMDANNLQDTPDAERILLIPIV